MIACRRPTPASIVAALLLLVTACSVSAAGTEAAGAGAAPPASAASPDGNSETRPALPAGPSGGVTPPDAARQLEFVPFHDKAFLEARRNGVPIVLVFEAEWCAPCKEMHETTFRAPAVLEAAVGARLFRVDLTTPDYEADVIRKSFGVQGAPTVILFGPDGKERGRRFGFIPAGDFAKMLDESRKPAAGT